MDDKNFDVSKLSQEELEKIAGGKLDRKFLSGTIAGLSLLTGSSALTQTSAAGNSHSTQSISINQENPTPGTQNEERVVSEDGEYTFKDGKLTIFKGSVSNLIINSNIDKTKIQEVEICKDAYIGGWAFQGCTNLKKVEIENGIEFIYECAFSGCHKLKEINIPDSVVFIGGNAFSRCSSLEKIEIPDSIDEIGNSFFNGCTSLKEIKISDNIIKIGENAFENCTSLEKMNIPYSVTSIGKSAFKDCTNLKEVKIESDITDIDENVFKGCTNLQNIELPDSVTSIKRWAFQDCANLKEIKLPDNIRYIGYGAFNGCTNLKNITAKPEMEYKLKRKIEKDIPNCKINGKELKDIKETSVK